MSSLFSPSGGVPTRACQRCNMPLAPQEVICATCGYQNAPAVPDALKQQQSQFRPPSSLGIGKSGGRGLMQYADQQSDDEKTHILNRPAPNREGGQQSGGQQALSRSSGTNFLRPQNLPAPPNSAFPDALQPKNPGPPPAAPGLLKNPASLAGFAVPPNNAYTPAHPPVVSSQESGAYPLNSGVYGPVPFVPQLNNYYGVSAPQPMLPVSQPSIPIQPGPSPVQPGNRRNFSTSAIQAIPAAPLSARPVANTPVQSSITGSVPPIMVRRDQEEQGPRWGRLIVVLLVIIVLIAGGFASYTFLIPHGPKTALQATPTSYQPRGTPLFSDTFASNTNGWNLQSETGKFSAAIANNALTLENSTHSLLWELLPGTRTYDNFQVAFDAVLSKGEQNNGYGIYIRGTADQKSDFASYYRFELYGDGSYAIFKGSTAASGQAVTTKLAGYTQDKAINKQGQINHILLVAKGPKITFTVNGQLLATLNDAGYTSGSLALFVSNLPEAKSGAQARFSKFAIYPAPK